MRRVKTVTETGIIYKRRCRVEEQLKSEKCTVYADKGVLSASKYETQEFVVESFDFWKLNDVEGKEWYWVRIIKKGFKKKTVHNTYSYKQLYCCVLVT